MKLPLVLTINAAGNRVFETLVWNRYIEVIVIRLEMLFFKHMLHYGYRFIAFCTQTSLHCKEV